MTLRESGGIAGNFSSESDSSFDLMARNIVAVRSGTSKEDMKKRFQEVQELISPVPYERD